MMTIRQARRWCRRLSSVGVTVSPERLVAISTGSGATEAENVDLRFALTALHLRDDQHSVRVRRRRQVRLRWLIVVAMTLVALNTLVCLGYLLFSALAPF
ncbi:hypothetical protein H7J07_01995 [Mycobacterium koreense]|nr:hypothetical protein [Mycolicibacillus koreensis]MCV7247031.1 hypothetical protein [Mycolicibacillus koreensis]